MLRRSSLRSLASPSKSRATLPPCAPARWRLAPPGASPRLRRAGVLRPSALLRLGPQRASVLKTDYYQLKTTLTCCKKNTNVFFQRKAFFSLSFSPPFPLLFPVAPSGAAGGCFAKPPIWRSSWLRRCSERPWLVGAARPHASPNATALAPSCLLAVRGAFGLGGFCRGVVAGSSQPLQNPPCSFRFPWLCRLQTAAARR